MRAVFRQPKWIVATLAVVVIAAVFVRLGFWQLDRLDERKTTNAIGQERLAAEPVRLPDLLAEAGDDLESIEFRRVIVEGTYDPAREVLIRSQVELGQAGFHVITPLHSDEGWSVLVNRGWVPLPMDTPPVEPTPAPGEVRQEGWVHLTETRPSLGPEDPPGDVSVFNRVDIGRIGEQVGEVLAPVYVVSLGEGSEVLPVPVNLPDFANEGPHLAYAIQWFGFALVGLVGFFFLVRNKGVQGK
ncbi:MAG TPA: SURF1 family protein [Acidimicrobiia bacterium]